ncbi:MAG: glycosyl transferase [Aequorivita sp.]|nr:glycosyl transferase [Aequorivita sp.]|tara:strand:+ start:26381 stop:27913 length:1533 start_codon:yes stop_codon:yes gene_type:complete
MIVVFHNNGRIVDLKSNFQLNLDDFKEHQVTTALFNLASEHSNCILVWCHESLKEYLNITQINTFFTHKNMMLSYGNHHYFSNLIGYIEDSPFVNVNKTVKYPTWLMSSQVGAIYGSQLIKFQNKINLKDTFDFVLNSIAKHGMPNGLFCYSEPRLVKNSAPIIQTEKASKNQLFKFVKLHYKSVWSSLLLLNILLYEGKFPFVAYLKNLFKSQQKFTLKFNLEPLVQSNYNKDVTIDVIIPTMGRRTYLLDVLKDLALQTHLPQQVIIVEQNKDENSTTELDFIETETWPFKIIHKFIHQTGACNARNLALKEVQADFVFLGDDDNRFKPNLLDLILYNFQTLELDVITMSYLQKNEKETRKTPVQWSTFGAGSSVVSTKCLKSISFDMALEYGYGEDVDFGMQLRNLGFDIIYFPNIKIEHLKAPIGGFRAKFKQPWERSSIQPKPSPTVMYNKLKNYTTQQLLGYKTVLFFKYYKVQNIKNPISYFKLFRKRWAQSMYWAKRLQNKI